MNEQSPSPVFSGPPKRVGTYLAMTTISLSLIAAAIVFGNVVERVPHVSDEGASAHLFQLAIAAQLPLFVLFLALADWSERRRTLLLVAGQIAAAAVAFGALAWSGY